MFRKGVGYPAAAKTEPFRAFGPSLAIHRASRPVWDPEPRLGLDPLSMLPGSWVLQLGRGRHEMVIAVNFNPVPAAGCGACFWFFAAELAGPSGVFTSASPGCGPRFGGSG